SSSALAQSHLKQALVTVNTAFSFSLLKQIAREQPEKNIFISPFSVSSALQMAANGAAGQTRQEMEGILGTSGMPQAMVNQTYKDLDQSIKNQTNVILNIANSLWYRKGFELKPEFISCNENFYGAKVGALDFGNPQAAETINAWVDDSTHGRIKQIISPPIKNSTKVILANAIYFKGTWTYQFDKKNTHLQDFKLLNDKRKQVQMMSLHRKLDYQQGNGFQAVRLPYSGGRLQMCVLLPDADSSVEKMLASLNSRTWRSEILAQFDNREGTLKLPRFKMDFEAELNGALETLGMRQAFEAGEADFSRMANGPLFISKVQQKSFVEVNEKGTEAAATTAVIMSLTAFSPEKEKPFTMVVDHPFIFVIYDSQTESILFTGVVYEPMDASAE
ncbi:MAG TPA: serpin family protein, partial [Verrucomicrobiae bacterium]|nr:serpin family protein [Verrucomicrobiae bacterium]